MEIKVENVAESDPRFPSSLRETQSPPSRLFVLGKLPKENSIKISIVGTRKATLAGKQIAKHIAKDLAQLDVVIVSGLAIGIDSAAHEGATEEKGITLAVLANGLDKIYPAQNENLARKIIELGGALISEYPLGTPSYPNQFLERNRIISGLSTATIVIEAPERSGSLATARFAIEQGREVFVVPGPVNHPNYAGSHKLIRDGARLITSAKDIFEDLGIEIPNYKAQITGNSHVQDVIKKITNKNQLLIFKTIVEAGEVLNIDKIAELTKLESQVINQSLALLIIDGVIKETERGYINII